MLYMVRTMYGEPHMLNFGEESEKRSYVGVAEFAANIGVRIGLYALHRAREGDCLELFRKPIKNVEGVVSEQGVWILHKIVEGNLSLIHI